MADSAQPLAATAEFFRDTFKSIADNAAACLTAYDLALAEGTNRITLRVADLAGNTTTTNITVRLDYTTELSSPGLTILWPPGGTQIAGDSFTVQAQVDNPTVTVQASIVDNAGNTNTVQGIIERNGSVWVKDTPLAAGTNILILSATSAAGHTSSTSISVIRSSVSVTLNPLSTNQLNESSVNLTGTVSNPSDGVWVNGIQARGSRQEEATFLQPCGHLDISETDLSGDDVARRFYRQWYGGNLENPPCDITIHFRQGSQAGVFGSRIQIWNKRELTCSSIRRSTSGSKALDYCARNEAVSTPHQTQEVRKK